jgi:hypothetical protein
MFGHSAGRMQQAPSFRRPAKRALLLGLKGLTDFVGTFVVCGLALGSVPLRLTTMRL